MPAFCKPTRSTADAFGSLMKFDTRAGTFETWKLPLLSPNEYETPYALNVHPKTGDVWITSNMSDRIFRFTPSTKTFVSYPLPTRVTWLRDLVFAEDGGICSSSSNLPAYGIEPRQRQAASSRPFSCRATQSLPDPRMATSSASSIRPRTPTPGTRPWTGSRLRR